MKKVLLILCILIANLLYSQDDWRLKINDPWFREIGSKGLQIGDSMPDIPFGNMVNNKSGITKFSELRGKLVILDYWNTSCTPCIAAMPEMEKLQKYFGNKIQIILVNPHETKDMVDNHPYKKIQFPDLPMIFADNTSDNWDGWLKVPLYKLFPNRGVPHHVWIDGNGIIRIIGRASNTYEKNISNLLAGKKYIAVSSYSNTPQITFDKTMPYYKLLPDVKSTSIAYGSFITPYNNEISATPNGARHLNIVDSKLLTRRTTLINYDVVYLYIEATRFLEFSKSVHLNNNQFFQLSGGILLNNVIYPKDTLSVTDYSAATGADGKAKYTNVEFIQSKYCYEQIMPLDLPREKQQQYMLEDLNRYFLQHLGITGHVEKRKIPCYLLVRTSMEDNIRSHLKSNTSVSRRVEFSMDTVIVRDKKMYKWEGSEFRMVIGMFMGCSSEVEKQLMANKKNGKPYMLFNETGIAHNQKVDMTLPFKDDIRSIDDVRKALRPYGLEITEGEKEVAFLVFRDVK